MRATRATRCLTVAMAGAALAAGSAGAALADEGAEGAKTTTKKVSSTVKLKSFTQGAAKGEVSSKKSACENGRLVSLFHFNVVTQNFDLVTVTKTTRKGSYTAQANIVEGDLYAVGVGKKKITKTKVKDGRRIVRKTICKKDTGNAKVA